MKPRPSFSTYVELIEQKAEPKVVVIAEQEIDTTTITEIAPPEPEIQESHEEEPILHEQVIVPPSQEIFFARLLERLEQIVPMQAPAPEPQHNEAFFAALIERLDQMTDQRALDESRDETFFTTLVERLEQVPAPVAQDSAIQQLQETQIAIVETLARINERTQTQSVDMTQPLSEMLENQQQMIEQISLTQSHIINTVKLLTEKIETMAAQPATVNVPAPIVNVKVQEGKQVTKLIERDEKGLITKITEGYISND